MKLALFPKTWRQQKSGRRISQFYVAYLHPFIYPLQLVNYILHPCTCHIIVTGVPKVTSEIRNSLIVRNYIAIALPVSSSIVEPVILGGSGAEESTSGEMSAPPSAPAPARKSGGGGGGKKKAAKKSGGKKKARKKK